VAFLGTKTEVPRIARAVLEGVPHHITQRGNARQIVFDTREDRLLYLDLLREYAERFYLKLWGYCLMSNHVHLIAVPSRRDSLARALGRTHTEYADTEHIATNMWTYLAGALLLLPSGRTASLERAGVRGKKPGPCRVGAESDGIRMVERGCSCNGGRRARVARPESLARTIQR
jgi:REP element-mobilizing transposase RayT